MLTSDIIIGEDLKNINENPENANISYFLRIACNVFAIIYVLDLIVKVDKEAYI